jgi:hypothetical protein
VQDDWRLKFLKVEQEAVDAYEERLQKAENGG